jgi:hypothetical protein
MKKHLHGSLITVLLSLLLLSLFSVVWAQAATKWNIETVDFGENVGPRTSLALDSSGNPHISYLNYTAHALKYASWSRLTGWSTETVISAGGIDFDTSLALDSSGNPHISYYEQSTQNLKYAEWTGTQWSIEIVDSDLADYISLVVDSSNKPHISYYAKHSALTLKGDLKYAEWNALDGWNPETVDSTSEEVGLWPSLALDSNGNPHISYHDSTNGDLKYNKWGSTGWSIETVDSTGDVGSSTSLALDSSGNPHISYYDYTNGDLKYATTATKPPFIADIINFLYNNLLMIVIGIIAVGAIAGAVWRRRK